jgi:hypothetical protein
MTPDEVVETFRRLLLDDLTPSMQSAGLRPRSSLGYTVDDVQRELRGRDLACWCPTWQACHGDVLLAVANSDDRCRDCDVPLIAANVWEPGTCLNCSPSVATLGAQ